MGKRTPEQVINDINHINNTVELECWGKGLNNPEWTCPKVSQDQTILIIARLLANYIEYQDEMVHGNRPPEDTNDEMVAALHRTVRNIRNGECVQQAQMKLHHDILTKGEHGGFIEQCTNGWRITTAWHEAISRQSPPPTPDWAFYQRNLPTELLR